MSRPSTVAQRRAHSWSVVAAWRCEGQPWEQTAQDPTPEASVALLCRCGRASYEHDPELKGAPATDTITGARLCEGFDPVARIRRVTYVELQTSRTDRLDDTPPP